MDKFFRCVNPFKFINLRFSLVSFKSFCCFWIALANFSFIELFTAYLVETVRFKSHNDYDYYQNNLYLMEFVCWFLPLIIYMIWSQSALVKINLNILLSICSIYTLFIVFGSFGCTFLFFIFLRIIHCALLSIAYWINFLDLLVLYSSKHLIPIGLYFFITCLAAVLSKFAVYVTFYLFYLIISFVFLALVFVNNKKKFYTINKSIFDDDFPLLEITFRGIRTSLAFFEIISMIAILQINIKPFLSSINLMNFNVEKFKDFQNKFIYLFFLESKIKKKSSRYNVYHDLIMNYCTIGLLFGFLFTSLIPIVKLKKRYVSYFVKASLVICVLQKFDFAWKMAGANQNFEDFCLFFLLSINFCTKINDIIYGFKLFLFLSGVERIKLEFLYLKSISLLIVGIFFGIAFGLITSSICFKIASNKDELNELKVIAQLFYIGIMIRCSFESLEYDDFLICRRRKPETHKAQEPETVNKTAQPNITGNNQPTDNSNQFNSADKSNQFNSADKSDRFSSNLKNSYNPDKFNSGRRGDKSLYYTNDPNHGLTGTNLQSAIPSAPMFDPETNSSNSRFFAQAPAINFNSRDNSRDDSRNNDSRLNRQSSNARVSRRAANTNRGQNQGSYNQNNDSYNQQQTQQQTQHHQPEQQTTTATDTNNATDWE